MSTPAHFVNTVPSIDPSDALMAFWNPPLDDPEHALHACEIGDSVNLASRLAGTQLG